MKQEPVKEGLVQLAREGKLMHAYILEGSNDDSLIQFARELAREVTPYGEDIHIICKDGLSVKDKTVEGLLVRLLSKPMVGERTVAVIRDADTMTHHAQNRLLKTLEEPPGGTILLLLSNNAEHLLPTIRSRCVLYRLDDGRECEGAYVEAACVQARSIGVMIMEGKSYYAIAGKLAEVTGEREQAFAFLDALEKWYRDILFCAMGIASKCTDSRMQKLSRLVTAEKVYGAIALIEEARRDISRHINTNHTIKNMVLKMI